MIRNVQLEVELFDNGITIRWEDLDGVIGDDRIIALEQEEEKAIGMEIWGDIQKVMEEAETGKVRLTIKYEAL